MSHLVQGPPSHRPQWSCVHRRLVCVTLCSTTCACASSQSPAVAAPEGVLRRFSSLCVAQSIGARGMVPLSLSRSLAAARRDKSNPRSLRGPTATVLKRLDELSVRAAAMRTLR